MVNIYNIIVAMIMGTFSPDFLIIHHHYPMGAIPFLIKFLMFH